MNSMIFWNVFKESLKLPRKKALFTLNRTGMDIVVVYLFILLLFVSIPPLIDRINDTQIANVQVKQFFRIIYFFIFYYLPLNVIVFSFISGIAYLGKGIAYVLKRKLHYSLLWKMTAYTTTIPFVVYTIIALFFPISDSILSIGIVYTIIILIRLITIYPKRRDA